MRVLALTRFRLRAALSGRVLLAPLVVFALVQVGGLVGGNGRAAVQLATAVALTSPVLAWAARQVLDAEPDEQGRLSMLAVGGRVRERAAGLLAALALTVPAGLLSAALALQQVDDCGRPVGVIFWGLLLAIGAALVAAAIGALASRHVAGDQGGGVLVLVGVPVVVAVLSTSHSPGLTALVPRLGEAVRAAFDSPSSPTCGPEPFAPAAPMIVLQVFLWAAVVLSVRLGWRRQL